MMNSGTMTLKQLYTLWQQMNPESGITTYENFVSELNECATYMHFVNEDYFTGRDAANAKNGEEKDGGAFYDE